MAVPDRVAYTITRAGRFTPQETDARVVSKEPVVGLNRKATATERAVKSLETFGVNSRRILSSVLRANRRRTTEIGMEPGDVANEMSGYSPLESLVRQLSPQENRQGMGMGALIGLGVAGAIGLAFNSFRDSMDGVDVDDFEMMDLEGFELDAEDIEPEAEPQAPEQPAQDNAPSPQQRRPARGRPVPQAPEPERSERAEQRRRPQTGDRPAPTRRIRRGDSRASAPRRAQPQSRPVQSRTQPAPRTSGRMAAFQSLIERGESRVAGTNPYNAYNRGTIGNRVIGPAMPVDLSRVTIAEYLRRSELSPRNRNRLFAVGRYQIIPDTMRQILNYDIVRNQGVSRSSYLTPATQEILFQGLLRKRRALYDYIVGNTGDLNAAILGMAMEWASVGIPYRIGRRARGDSYYGNGNRASITPEEAARAIRGLRQQYAQNGSFTSVPSQPIPESPTRVAERRARGGGGSQRVESRSARIVSTATAPPSRAPERESTSTIQGWLDHFTSWFD